MVFYSAATLVWALELVRGFLSDTTSWGRWYGEHSSYTCVNLLVALLYLLVLLRCHLLQYLRKGRAIDEVLGTCSWRFLVHWLEKHLTASLDVLALLVGGANRTGALAVIVCFLCDVVLGVRQKGCRNCSLVHFLLALKFWILLVLRKCMIQSFKRVSFLSERWCCLFQLSFIPVFSSISKLDCFVLNSR